MKNEELLPDFGTLFGLYEFIRYCKEGYLIDEDGIGFYSNGRVFWRDEIAYPSDMIGERIKYNTEFRFVIWFNK